MELDGKLPSKRSVRKKIKTEIEVDGNEIEEVEYSSLDLIQCKFPNVLLSEFQLFLNNGTTGGNRDPSTGVRSESNDSTAPSNAKYTGTTAWIPKMVRGVRLGPGYAF